jgi:predicted transcriptional regulator
MRTWLASPAELTEAFLRALNLWVEGHRLQHGVTIPDLSDKSRVAVGTIWNVENGVGDAQVSTLQKIAEALGITITLIPS